MVIDFLLEVFSENRNKDAIAWRDHQYSYRWLLEQVDEWSENLPVKGIHSGTVIGFEAGFSAMSIAAFLGLIKQNCIIALIPPDTVIQKQEFYDLAEIEWVLRIEEDNNFTFQKTTRQATHPYFKQLREANLPGLVLFSSGSTGKSKGVVHDLSKLLIKYQKKGKDFRTLLFLSFDHIGGIDTLLYILSNGSCAIIPQSLSPDDVCRAIERFQVEVLPANPAFINLLLLSESYQHYDLSSLKYITYGAEIMPELTLHRVHDLFPNVTITQKYGTSEVGTLHSKSQSSDSLWVKIGGDEYQTRVVDGMLQIKTDSAMIGYLNAPSPFTDDGWFITGDEVIVQGEYYKILGRKSDIINVGGEKVFPSEVENVIMEVDNIGEAAVYGEPNNILGNIVCARVKLIVPEPRSEITSRIKKHCAERLERYKCPIKIAISDDSVYNTRYKIKRSGDPESDGSVPDRRFYFFYDNEV